ncbi:MAG: TIGR01777 family oxidoreductase [Caldilineaceae bacterium]|nr:TIGR01777 family oxidoreductase [Caldilineaceae bacterium]
MRIIISGGSGLIGSALGKALIADGHEVIFLSRNPDKVKDAPAGVKLRKWDGESAAGWQDLAQGDYALINLAGETIAQRWSKDSKQAIRQSRVNAGKAFMELVNVAEVKPRVLIQSSAVGYYGTKTGDAQVTESFSPGNDFLAKVCFDWEISTAPASKLGIRRPVIRTGIVLSTEGGALPQQLLPFKLFVGGPVGSGNQWYPWIHLDDEVRAIQFVLTNDKADGPFNLTAPNPVTNKEFGKLVGEVMGRPSVMPAPGFAMKTIFGDMSLLLLEGQRAVPQKLLELGFKFKFETAQAALRDLLGDKASTAPSAPNGNGAAKSEPATAEKAIAGEEVKQ